MNVGYFIVLDHLVLRVTDGRNSANLLLVHKPPSVNEISRLHKEYNTYIHAVIHGHVHKKKPLFYEKGKIPYLNLSIEQTNYSPVTLNDVIQLLSKNTKIREIQKLVHNISTLLFSTSI